MQVLLEHTLFILLIYGEAAGEAQYFSDLETRKFYKIHKNGHVCKLCNFKSGQETCP
jgi:hypothetical protein